MASHIASPSKLDGLRACLLTIAAQTWAAKHTSQALCLLVSFSASSEELRKRARQLFRELIPEHVVLEQPTTRSQFEHYTALAAWVAERCSAAARRRLWIGFSDDDDVWHPRRLETFYQGVHQVDAEKAVTQLRFPWFAVRCDDAPAACEHVLSAEAVDTMLQRGEARLWNTEASELDSSEHWTGISRLTLLDAFLSVAPAKLVASRFADLAWERYSAQFALDARGKPVVDGGESVPVQWTKQQPWMYYYNVPPGGSMLAQCQQMPFSDEAAHYSSHVEEPTAEERKIAVRVLAELPGRAATERRAEGDAAVERIARKLAHLRRNLSVTCAQRLWPLRAMVSGEQMLAALWKDLQRCWEGYAPNVRSNATAEDCVLLDASKPLRALLRDFGIAQEVASLFEANIAKLAAGARASARR